MTPDGAKALPCPFCAAEAVVFKYSKLVGVKCDGADETCCAETRGWKATRFALEAWNRRTPDPATQRVLDCLAEYKSEMTNPSKDLILCSMRRKELFKAVEALAGREA